MKFWRYGVAIWAYRYVIIDQRENLLYREELIVLYHEDLDMRTRS